MNRKNSFLFALLALVALSLSSCSGIKQQVCTVNCNVAGNANVTLTLFDAPPAGVSFITLNMPISLISLTPTTGADVNLLSTSTTFELTRLQSDSTGIGTFQVPAGTFTKLNIFVTNSPSGVWFNGSGSTIIGCNTLTICNFAGGAQGQLSIDLTKVAGLSGQGLVLTSGENTSLGIELNLNKALTATGGLSFDLKQTGALTAITLPRTGQPSGTIDTLQDFLGKVTAVSGGKITLQNNAGLTFIGTASSTTTTFDPPPLPPTPAPCGGNFNLACVAVGQTLSVDGNVAADGTVALTNVDFLDIPASDELQGTIFHTTTAGKFLLIVNDKIQTSANAVLTPVGPGFTLNVTLDPAATFAVDTSNLGITNPAGFLDATDISDGQNVLVHVKSATPAAAGVLVNVLADRMVLRFSRLTGTVATISGNVLTIQNFQSFFGTPNVPPQVQTFVPQTNFDNVTGGNIGGLSVGDSVSIRALFLNPTKVSQPFLAATVRKH
ncbi:MAG TPA: DUF4382 domain-containing protein [Candidatus Dormibacteraeota bacterium]|nr:DUF4382 domain-containing protein [Candidatus Dormibacteraeota bacterium]